MKREEFENLPTIDLDDNTIEYCVNQEIADKLFDHIESIEAENRKLDQRLREVYYDCDCLEYAEKVLKDKVISLEATKKAHEAERKNMVDTHANNIAMLVAKNKELKEKLEETSAMYHASQLAICIEETLKDQIEAKLEAIQSNKVAEFSEEMEFDDDNKCFMMISDNYYISADSYQKLSIGKRYTVTISKDK